MLIFGRGVAPPSTFVGYKMAGINHVDTASIAQGYYRNC